MKSLFISLLLLAILSQTHSGFANDKVLLLTDSIREVDIHVTVKEIAINYDSIFNARLVENTANQKNINPIEITTYKKPKSKSVNKAVQVAPILLPVDEKPSSPDVEEVSRTIEEINQSSKNPKPSTQIPDSLNPETGAFTMDPSNDISQKGTVSKKTKTTSNYSAWEITNHKLTYLWLGTILMLLGVIGGLGFNRKAFLISGLGVIFLLIGLYL